MLDGCTVPTVPMPIDILLVDSIVNRVELLSHRGTSLKATFIAETPFILPAYSVIECSI